MTAQLSQPTHEVRVLYDLKARMRDDIKLSNDVFLPRQPGRYPTILLRTPYETLHEPHIDWAVWWARRGYAVVLQDCRGRFESEGTFYPYRDDGPDGHDTPASRPSRMKCLDGLARNRKKLRKRKETIDLRLPR